MDTGVMSIRIVLGQVVFESNAFFYILQGFQNYIVAKLKKISS